MTQTATPLRALLVMAVMLLPSLAAALPAAPLVSGPPWGAWWTETVDDRWIGGGGYTRLGLDRDAPPNILYAFSDDGWHIAYAKWSSGGWMRETLVRGVWPGGVAFDAEGLPHVTFHGDNALSGLAYAWKATDGIWRYERAHADVSTIPGGIRLDASGGVHIAYEVHLSGMWYAYRNPEGSWINEFLEGDSALWHGMALDSEGRPHIGYSGGGGPGGVARYAWRDHDGTWYKETAVENCGIDVTFAMGPDDSPHIACWGRLEGLRYAWKDATGWNSELADAGTWKGFEPSLVIDAKGQPHISYRNNPNFFWLDDPLRPGHLFYTTKDPQLGWIREQVERRGQWSGGWSTLQLDSRGHPHISYEYTWSRQGTGESILFPYRDLKYATPVVALADR